MAWTTTAPAKVNLDLRLRGVRTDGYHLLETVFQSIALADTVVLRPRPGPFAMACETPGVPTDARNLAWRGAAAMASALGTSLDGWELRLDKRVPAEAGLGGGSADAAAAARLVAAAAGVALDAAALAEVIGPLGADVAFFAWGGAMRGVGVGDDLSPLPDVPAAAVVLVRPPFGVATSAAYRWFDEMVRAEGRDGRSSAGGGYRAPAARAGAAIADPDAGEPPWSLDGAGNDLEAPVAARHPEIRAIVERLRTAGAHHAAMSGSGSACFGLFPPDRDLRFLEGGWPPGSQVWRTHLLSRAAYADRTSCVPA